MTRHECKVPSCEKSIVDAFIMCRRHWFMVDQSTRRLVLLLWKQVVEGENLPDGVGAVKKYREAVDLAVAQVDAKIQNTV